MPLVKEDICAAIAQKISAELGVQVSKEKAWKIFKECINTPYEVICANYVAEGRPQITEGKSLDCLVMSLAGVGRFEVKGTVHRNEDGSTVINPKPKFYPSSTLQETIKNKL